jgi:hypothetical protein
VDRYRIGACAMVALTVLQIIVGIVEILVAIHISRRQ